jgi:eukaryotic-like serine/threonine-protein kinase
MDRVLAGRYELEVPLGRGGSGEVWRGRDMATSRPVAVKLVELSLIDDPGLLAETIARFRREASVISGLHHPNIVGAIDAGRIGNQLFMVMELAPGISLASMMDERGARGMGLFPLSSVLRIAEQVCAGLAAAHAAGIVHRDIKPSNLMVTPSLGIKIIDFGIAALLADNSPRLTLPAQTVGTIAYMSPEQAQGVEVDARSDLYSLGCVLYQLLAGHPPFFSTLPSALLMMQVMDRAVPLSNVRPELPPEVSKLVSDLMEKQRDARPANAEQVISRIAEIKAQSGDEENEFEADRQTVMASDHLGAGGATLVDDVTQQANRPTFLTPERMAQLAGPEAVTAAPGRSAGPGQTVGPGPWAPAQPFRPSTPFQAPYQGPYPAPAQTPYQAPYQPPYVPSQSAPLRLPQMGAGTGQGPAVPMWPVTPPPRRRSAWTGVISTLVTAAIVAGAGAYYWVRTHEKLDITKVEVTSSKPTVGCNGTANLIGTITTNGKGGPIQYEWVLGGAKKGVLKATAGTESDTVQVTMSWTFHGKGDGSYVAELDTLSPQSDQASFTFPYSCPK